MDAELTGTGSSGLARKIATDAVAAGAERIAFQRDGIFSFAAPEPAAVESALRENRPRKFKFQIRSGAAWVDSSPYALVDTGAGVIAALRRGDLQRLRSETPDSVARAAAIDREVFSVALRGFHRSLFDALNRDPAGKQVARSLAFLEKQKSLFGDPHFDYLRSMVSLYDVLVEHGLASVVRGGAITGALTALQEHVQARPDLFGTIPGRIAVESTFGKLHSLRDRDAAAGHFARVRELDAYGLIEHFYLETGNKTYFSAEEIGRGDGNAAREIRRSIVPLDAHAPSNAASIVIAMDPGFYRTYAPMLRFYAQQMPDLDYTFLLCGDEDEARRAVDDGNDFARSLDGLNRSGVPATVHHYRVPVPPSVIDTVTFFASARFFAPEILLERYTSVYLMDADLATDTDPRDYLRRVSTLTFALPSMAGFAALHPWRRYLAGNVALHRTVLDTPVLSDLQNYLAFGLGQPHSWTLDQNALAYTVERNPEHFTDLRSQERPFYQPKFRLAWERRYRDHSDEHQG